MSTLYNYGHRVSSNRTHQVMTTVPISPTSDWVEIHTDASSTPTDINSPVAEIIATSGAAKLLDVSNSGTSILIRCQYASGNSIPSLRVFGFDSTAYSSAADTNPMNLADVDGNLVVSLSSAATDAKDEDGLLHTESVQVDCKGCSMVGVLVSSAGTATVKVQAKVL